MPLVITSVGGGHTDTHFADRINVWHGWHVPGLKVKLYVACNISRDLKTTTIILFDVSHIVFWQMCLSYFKKLFHNVGQHKIVNIRTNKHI